MTVSIAWVRTLRDCEELVFVSDSRLSGDGREIDCCAKILPLPRTDCIISFAGQTADAYPLMHQLFNAIDAHAPLKRRTMDVPAVKTQSLKIFNSMSSSIQTTIPELREPQTAFIFGGYSWVNKDFELWTISYQPSVSRFEANPARYAMTNRFASNLFFGYDNNNGNEVLGKIAFGGDQGKEAKDRLVEKMSEKLPDLLDSGERITFDMEPFEVVRDMLRDDNRAASIGGPPQVAKVYQYSDSCPIGVYWPKKVGGEPTLTGRSLFGFERIDYWILDPDTLQSSNPNFSDE